MDQTQRQYYDTMLERGRGYIIIDDGHVRGILTFAIGSNDYKYLYSRDPWTLLDDEPNGDTVYIEQLITTHDTHNIIRKQFRAILADIKHRFKNVDKVKWARAPAEFRKHKIRGRKPNVYCKSIK